MRWNSVFKLYCMFALIVAWTIVAGIDQPQPPWGAECNDRDQDGYGDPGSQVCPHPERDCDDERPDVNPGEREGPLGDPTCADGLDNNCDGLVDAADAGCYECFYDEDCDDENPCTEDQCDGGVCSHVATTQPCDDHNACTVGDICSRGTCVGGPSLACDDEDACTTDACDPVVGCVHEEVICYDGNACTTDMCDPLTGCVHGAVSCDDGNPCTDDSCDPSTGCVHTSNTLPCDDGDPCTMNDRCEAGICTGVLLDVDGDGYASSSCGGSDCNDSNGTVYTGAPELCDGIDNQCPGDPGYGEVDEGCQPPCIDHDGDGYGSPASSSCTYPEEDCYDYNPNAYPGSTYWSSTHRGDGSFDYNCDGVETKRWEGQADCVDWQPSPPSCTPVWGWYPGCYDPVQGWPSCGTPCPYLIGCLWKWMGWCDPTYYEVVQECR